MVALTATEVILSLTPLLLFPLTPGGTLLIRQATVVAAPIVIVIVAALCFGASSLLFESASLSLIIPLPIAGSLRPQTFLFLAALLIAQLLVLPLLVIARALPVAIALIGLATLFFSLATLLI